MINDLKYQIALSFCKGLGPKYTKQLLHSFGLAKMVWQEKLSTLQEKSKIPLINLMDIGRDEILTMAENELLFCEQNQIEILSFFDDAYPYYLKQCDDAPLILYYKGRIDFKNELNVSIVGSRKMTAYGAKFIQELITDLRDYPICIVSGLAYGCDIQAHRTALSFGLPTWGVLAHHLNKVYPAKHKKEAQEMLANGGLISEYSSQHALIPECFLQRNRIIAGLSPTTIIVESSYSGGALVTAKFANEYNRDVFALPGRNSDEMSRGNNHLIKTHQAYLIENAQDLLYHLNIQSKENKTKQVEMFVDLTETEQKIVQLLQKNQKLHIDQLADLSNQYTYQLLPILLDLELKQLVKPLPGKFFELI